MDELWSMDIIAMLIWYMWKLELDAPLIVFGVHGGCFAADLLMSCINICCR